MLIGLSSCFLGFFKESKWKDYLRILFACKKKGKIFFLWLSMFCFSVRMCSYFYLFIRKNMVFILLWFILWSSFCFEILVFLLLCFTMTSISKDVVLCLCPVSKGPAHFFSLPSFPEGKSKFMLILPKCWILILKTAFLMYPVPKNNSSVKMNAIRAVDLDVSSDSFLFLFLWK